MLKVGLTGGLACGKTFISLELERLGCHVIHADALGHEVLSREGEAYQPVIDLFGPTILDANSDISRPKLAEVVFNDAEKLSALNAIVHPAVRRREDQLMSAITKDEPDAVAVVEAAILIEAGTYRHFDRMIVVVCDEASQFERALARDPLATPAAVRARLQRQMPMSEKRKFADFLIDTSGSKQKTLRQTQEIYTALLQLASMPKPGLAKIGTSL